MKVLFPWFSILTSLVLLCSCSVQKDSLGGSTRVEQKYSSREKNPTKKMTYLALGDSYTIGESVAEKDRWPVQLADALNLQDFDFATPNIIARTGWRSDQLLAAMEDGIGKEKYDLVSVLIGVNNQYQGASLAAFKKDFKIILKQAIAACKVGKKHVFVVGIPDYGVTPYGKNSGKQHISEEIASYNDACKTISASFGVPFYPITKISLRAEDEPDLVAPDGLHPSGKMYRLWVEKILPKVKDQLSE